MLSFPTGLVDGGWLYGSPYSACDRSSVPQLSRHVLEKCLFLYFFYEKGAEVLAPPAAPTTLVFCPGGIDCTSCFEENASSCVLLQCEKERMVFPSAAHSLYPHDFSYISLLTSWTFIYLKTSLRQQGKCCKPTVRLCSRRAAWQAAGSECASGSDNVWQQQGL